MAKSVPLPALVAEVERLLEGSEQEMPGKEAVTDFGFRLKRVTTEVFAQSNRVLDEIKRLK
jgi:hypothetical protein